MKKVLFALLLMVILTGLLGCKTTRATQETATKQDVMTTQVTDTSRTEQTETTDQLTAALSSNERQNMVIEFEEWEYYPTQADTTGESHAQDSGLFTRTGEASDHKPPNAGSVKKRRKGTITINADKRTESISRQQTTASIDVQATGRTKTDTKARISENTKSTKDTIRGKWFVWLIAGLLLAAVFVWIGTDIARRANNR